jgi:hypothetical protein
MKKLLLALVVPAAVAVAVFSPAAGAGGWATVGLSSLPTGVGPGDKWKVDMTVLQHGDKPLAGIAPVLTITNGDGTISKAFVGAPTGTPGVYRAEVVFPSEGTWSYQVWDDFSQTHTFKPVEITGPENGFPWLELVLALAVSLGLAAATVVLLRRRGTAEPAPVSNLREAA